MGNPQRADLMPLKDYLGQAIRLDAVDDHLFIERSQGGMTLRSTEAFFDRLKKTGFLDGMGIEMESKGWRGSQSDGEYSRAFSAQVPDAGGIRLIFSERTSERRVPFSLSNLALEPTSVAPGAAKVVRTVEIEPSMVAGE